MKNKEHRPFHHQIESAKFKIANPRCYDFSDLGTGKTLSSLWPADFLIINEKVRRVLIITPLSTMHAVWAREIFSNFPHRRYGIAHGSREHRAHVIKSNVEFVIINHDGIVIMEEEIIKAKFDIIITDELTAFKKHTTNRSKALQRIQKSARGHWGLTGAPTPNGPVEAYGQAKCVNPSNPNVPKYFKQFQNSVEQQVGPFVWIAKPDAANIVNNMLQPAIRFKRDDCLDLPECQYEETVVEFTEQQKKVYAKMKDDLLVEYHSGEITAVNAAVKAMKLLQIAAGSVKDDQGNVLHLDVSTREDELWRIFEETGKTKLVVFCAFRASIDRLQDFLTKKGAKVGVINGDVPHANRGRLIDAFQNSDLEILVIQPQSSAHGITLTKANVIVWYSLVPSGEIYMQANGRITRAGQTRKQYIIHLIGCKAEKNIMNILQGKGNTSQEVLALFESL
jgi:SNF2 family DNA or RNA helicase